VILRNFILYFILGFNGGLRYPKINYMVSSFDSGKDLKESCKSPAESESSLASGKID
jgi:hypothetical protein